MSDIIIISSGSADNEVIEGKRLTEQLLALPIKRLLIKDIDLPMRKKRYKRRRHKSYFGKSYEQEKCSAY